MVSDTAKGWQNDIAREITIQVPPVDGRDLEADVEAARQIVSAQAGISDVLVKGIFLALNAGDAPVRPCRIRVRGFGLCQDRDGTVFSGAKSKTESGDSTPDNDEIVCFH